MTIALMGQEFAFRAIGVIHSPHTEPSKTPIQPVFAAGVRGTLSIDFRYAGGLKDLKGFSHIHLLYPFHQTQETKLFVKPFLQDEVRGIFATRAPCRPNKLGLSIVKLISIDGCELTVEDLDILDGTPLLDIKPYIGRFDVRDSVRSGWQDRVGDGEAAVRGQRGFQPAATVEGSTHESGSPVKIEGK